MLLMPIVAWHGGSAPRAVAAELRRRGWTIVRPGPDADGPAVVLTRTSRRTPAPPVRASGWIWMAAAPVSDARRRDAILRGAYDVIAVADAGAIDRLVRRLEELNAPRPALPDGGPLVLESDVARRIAHQVARIASTSMPVLFTGETGTGKEIMARLTHTWSARAKRPFVPINCAAIPNELMEAELFGYARGAFSGAVQRYDGQLMAAEGGTVFLDEIHETPLETQVKLLRVLEDRVVSRLGENAWHEVDFRILAATNRDLRSLIEAGAFGADLYERLAIVTIHLPPLRERVEDLPALVRHFMGRFAAEQGRPAVGAIQPAALGALAAYPWPGNIRELRNVIYETLAYKRAGDELLLSDLPRRLLTHGRTEVAGHAADRRVVAGGIARGTFNLREEVAALERMAVDEALARTGGNAAQAARLLGEVGRGAARDPGGTVRAMMRRLNRVARR